MSRTDLISRQAAIEEIERSAYRHTYLDQIIDIVKSLPSAQPEQSDTSVFWRKRADYYFDMCMNLIGEMGKGVKIKSVKISENGIEFIKELPSAQPEPLTDKEQMIFLAAMGREEKVCEEVDRNCVREPYEDSLMRVCREIRRKVKGALWT